MGPQSTAFAADLGRCSGGILLDFCAGVHKLGSGMNSLLDTPKLLDKQIDRLYSLPLEDFRAARDELARGLRASADRDGARRVRLLERPQPDAWTVNQLARRWPQDLQALFAAVDRVSAAEAAALAGEPTAAVREALDAERAALGKLLDTANQLLAPAERRRHGVLQQVAAILRLGAADPESRRLLQAGRLTGGLPPAVPAAADAPVTPRRRREDRQRAGQERIRGLETEIRDLKLAVRVAEGRVRDAEREAERTHREAEDARADLRRAELELQAARAEF
jgi:hypothetical protein